jgi:hypothetical protein
LLSLGQSGDFIYQVQSGYFGEDSFEYRISSAGVESNIALVQLMIVDQQAPSIEWTSPVQNVGERYDLYDGEQVMLEVHASDNHMVALVTFNRWDAVNLEFVNIASIDQSPYRAEVNAAEFDPGWNQVNVTAFDQSENGSEYSYIWIYKHIGVNTINQKIFLPLTLK